MNVLDKQIVVKLNARWQAFETCTVAQAVTFLHSESNGRKPGFAIDYQTVTDSQGNISLVYAQPMSWEQWIQLPIRENDLWIGVGKSEHCMDGRIRAPLVVICANYEALPETQTRWSPEAVRRRDKDTCQVTGDRLAPGEGNVGHDVAQSRDKSRKRDWTNTAYIRKDLNTKQGTKTFSEMGWKLLKKPVAPKKTVKVLTKADAKHPSQLPFLL